MDAEEEKTDTNVQWKSCCLIIDKMCFDRKSGLINHFTIPFHHLVTIISFPYDDMIYK